MENLETAIVQIKQELPGLCLMENEPMSAHSSFKIGGPARALAVPSDVSSLSKICHILKLNKLDFTKHPMAKQIVKASVYDYKPAADTMIPEPIRSDIEPTPPKKAARRKSLYSSAQPPSEF